MTPVVLAFFDTNVAMIATPMIAVKTVTTDVTNCSDMIVFSSQKTVDKAETPLPNAFDATGLNAVWSIDAKPWVPAWITPVVLVLFETKVAMIATPMIAVTILTSDVTAVFKM